MSSDGVDYAADADITLKLDQLRENYVASGGASAVSWLELRASFARIIPYLSPSWYRHWSEFAYPLAFHNGPNPTYDFRNQGPIPTSNPQNNQDRLFIFAPTREGEGEDYPADGFVGDEQLQQVQSIQSGKRPVSVRSTEPLRTSGAGPSNVPVQSGQGFFNQQFEEVLPGILPTGNITTEDRIEMLALANKEANETIRVLLDNQSKGKQKAHHKHKDDSSDSSDSSADKEDKKKRKFAFILKAIPVSEFEAVFTPAAKRFAEDVKGYETNIALAVREFNRAGKPAHFPEVLSKELLLGKFIDVRRIKGELLNRKKGDVAYSTTGKEKGLEVSKQYSLEIDDLAEWQHYFSILEKAIEMGFPDCGKQISDYSEYINSQFWSGPIRANWKNIADYDAAFRSQVADRRCVFF